MPPPLPDWFANGATGVADAVSFGLGRRAREAIGFGWKADPCSTAYKVGEWGSLIGGGGRIAYAGAAKALPRLVSRSGDDLADAMAMSAGRNFLKRIFRGGTFPNYKIYTPTQILQKYGDDAATIAQKATATNPGWNALGANAAAGSVVNRATNGCECK